MVWKTSTDFKYFRVTVAPLAFPARKRFQKDPATKIYQERRGVQQGWYRSTQRLRKGKQQVDVEHAITDEVLALMMILWKVEQTSQNISHHLRFKNESFSRLHPK